MQSKSHTTQPPNRYSEASLTRALEEMGIGRPSTYASIIDTILARDYVFKAKRGNVLVPTWTAFAVSQLLEAHLPDLVNYQFTAEMEDELDAISRGELDYLEYLRHFYYGKDEKGLKGLVVSKTGEIDARDVCRVKIGQPEGQPEVFVRVGRYGPFLEQGERRASIPEQTPPDELTLDAALKMLETSTQNEAPLGHAPDGKPVFLKVGRFGPYVQHGDAAGRGEAAKRLAAQGDEARGRDPRRGVEALLAAADLGPGSPADSRSMAHNGPYGPYVKCDEGDPFASGRAFAAGRDARASRGAFGPAQGERSRPRGREAGTAEGFRGLAGDPKSGAVAGRPLRTLRDRRRDQCLASPRHRAGGGDVGICLESLEGPGRAGPGEASRPPHGEEGPPPRKRRPRRRQRRQRKRRRRNRGKRAAGDRSRFRSPGRKRKIIVCAGRNGPLEFRL